MADLATGLYALASILAERLGDCSTHGYRHVEIAMFDVMAEWMMPLLLAQMEEGRVTPPAGLHHTSIAPYGAFLTGGDEYVNIAVQHEKHWLLLCEDVLHDSSLVSEPLFATNESRVENRELLAKRIEETTCTLSAEELGRRLDEAGIAWGRLNDAEAMVDHPQLVSRDRWTDAVSPTGRPLRVLRSPLPDGNDEVRGKVPALGEHTDAVLSSLGYDRDAIAQLEEIGVVTTHRTTIEAHPGQEEENQ